MSDNTIPVNLVDDFYSKFILCAKNNNSGVFYFNKMMSGRKFYDLLGLQYSDNTNKDRGTTSNEDNGIHALLAEKINATQNDYTITIHRGHCDGANCFFEYNTLQKPVNPVTLTEATINIRNMFGKYIKDKQTKPFTINLNDNNRKVLLSNKPSYFLNKQEFDKELSQRVSTALDLKVELTSSCDFGNNVCQFTFTQPANNNVNELPIKTSVNTSKSDDGSFVGGMIVGGLVVGLLSTLK